MSLEDVHVKEEPWSPESGVSEAAARAGLYEGHHVKEELVIGPEMLQPRDQTHVVEGHMFNIAAANKSLERICVKREICSSPSEDFFSMSEPELKQEPVSGGQLQLRECFVRVENIIDAMCKCSRCGKIFACKASLSSHMCHSIVSLENRLIDKMHKCHHCPKIFTSDAGLSSHNCHSGESDAKTSKHNRRKNKRNYICDAYDKHYVSRVSLINHLIIHAGERLFMCEVCGKQFRHRRNLTSHLMLHTGRKPFSCKTCLKRFVRKDSLNRHIKLHTEKKNSPEKRYKNTLIDKLHKCHHCPKQSRSMSEAGLSSHICHSGESDAKTSKHNLGNKKRNYICDACGRHYVHRVSFVSHLIIHAGEKLFMCEVCGKQYIHKSSLRCHLMLHTEHKYLCDICLKGFDLKCTLIHHIHTHTEQKRLSCKICSKQFVSKSTLNRHIRLHTEEKKAPEKRFSCDFCSRQFAQKHHLIRHKRTHTGEKPFSCGICFKQFSLKHHLTRHELTAKRPCWYKICRNEQ